jgi:superfamily I DNA/RNA helicase/RecB family exonuclease
MADVSAGVREEGARRGAVAGGSRRVSSHEVTLVRPVAAPSEPFVPDPQQQAALSRPTGSGPLVVLGAPGTGKTQVLVELVAARVAGGVAADQVMVWAPSRTAAAALRDDVSTRLLGRGGRSVREPLARTAHSYAYGLLRRARVLAGDLPPRLISGPEQDRVLAELLAGHEAGEVPGPDWPSSVPPPTRELAAFRGELRDLLMRSVERGVTPEHLADLGRRSSRPDWLAAAEVYGEYLDVTALATPGAYDPAAIVEAAVDLLERDDELLAEQRRRWRLVAVDDAHELTSSTARLLAVLTSGGGDLVLVGDPDCTTQGFRGARPQLLAQAASRLQSATGAAAETVVLRRVHRHGPLLRSVAARVAERIASAGVVAHRAALAAVRHVEDVVVPDVVVPDDGHVEVQVLASAGQEAAFVAQALRRAHLADGVPWRQMAVVVRSTRATQALRRSLGAVGIPVAVPAAEVPVRDEPAVEPLRLALRCALDPGELTPEAAVTLLAGPVGGADALAVRRLRQQLRAAELAEGGERGSDELLVELVGHPGNVLLLDEAHAGPPRRVAVLLDAGRAALVEPGASAETVLWQLWQATGLAEPWRRTALAGGTAGARADRDLDAVVALFVAAARFVDRLPHAGPAAFLDYLDGQDLPSDTLAERAPSVEAVALVTAAGAAGRQWDIVAVTGVQEGAWPDLRLRSSLLGAAQLADLVDGREAPTSAQRRAVLDEELRLFHVAVSRARRRLLVTAVRNDDVQPSSFLDLVDDPPGETDLRALAAVPRGMTLPALVAELRAQLLTPATTAAEQARHRAAAHQLARLAAAEVPGADPQDWYGLAALSSQAPLRGDDEVVVVSPSKVESFGRCAMRWLLESSGGQAAVTTNRALGTLVHDLARDVPDGDETRLKELLAQRFPELGLGEGWVADVDRRRAERMVAKLSEYVRAAAGQGRQLVAVEQPVQVQLGRALVKGTVDRLEQDGEGRLHVVDLKTGKSAPAKADLDRHPQLGVYQLAVDAGGFDDLAPGAGSGGARLVHLGTDTKSLGVQAQRPLGDDDEPTWAADLVAATADGMAASTFPASVNAMCRFCDVARCCPLQPHGRQVGE